MMNQRNMINLVRLRKELVRLRNVVGFQENLRALDKHGTLVSQRLPVTGVTILWSALSIYEPGSALALKVSEYGGFVLRSVMCV